MNNVKNILDYKKDPSEDFYGLLGCDRTSNTEQILTEFKLRARDVHPDKCQDDDAVERFKQLQTAKEVLTDPEERKRYDKWLDSGLAVSYKNWRGLKDSVHTSMHWATPKTIGRMLGVDPSDPDDQISLRASPISEGEDGEDKENREVSKNDQDDDDDTNDDITYEPTPYDKLGFRVETPPPEFGWDRPREEREYEAKKQFEREEKQAKMMKEKDTKKDKTNKAALQRRQLFAQRRDSSIGTAMIVQPIDDDEMRRRFRNYEI